MPQTVRDNILFAIKRSGAQSAPQIASKLNVTPQAVQQHLAKLHGDGLIAWDDRRQGRGRPRRFWSLTEKGHGRFPDRHSDLTIDLLRSVEREFGPDGLDRLIARREAEMLSAYGEAIAGAHDLGEKVERLADLRSQEGYMAEYRSSEGGGYLLIENHCPICAAATMCQGLCRSELRLFQSVLGEDVVVERTDHVLAGARRCAYRITPR